MSNIYTPTANTTDVWTYETPIPPSAIYLLKRAAHRAQTTYKLRQYIRGFLEQMLGGDRRELILKKMYDQLGTQPPNMSVKILSYKCAMPKDPKNVAPSDGVITVDRLVQDTDMLDRIRACFGDDFRVVHDSVVESTTDSITLYHCTITVVLNDQC